MLSKKAQIQLQRFLKTVESEIGFPTTSVQLYVHGADQATADYLHNEMLFAMEQNGNFHWVHRELKTDKGVRVRMSAFYEPEEKEIGSVCEECGAALDEWENEHIVCQPCYKKQQSAHTVDTKHHDHEFFSSRL